MPGSAHFIKIEAGAPTPQKAARRADPATAGCHRPASPHGHRTPLRHPGHGPHPPLHLVGLMVGSHQPVEQDDDVWRVDHECHGGDGMTGWASRLVGEGTNDPGRASRPRQMLKSCGRSTPPLMPCSPCSTWRQPSLSTAGGRSRTRRRPRRRHPGHEHFKRPAGRRPVRGRIVGIVSLSDVRRAIEHAERARR